MSRWEQHFHSSRRHISHWKIRRLTARRTRQPSIHPNFPARVTLSDLRWEVGRTTGRKDGASRQTAESYESKQQKLRLEANPSIRRAFRIFSSGGVLSRLGRCLFPWKPVSTTGINAPV